MKTCRNRSKVVKVEDAVVYNQCAGKVGKSVNHIVMHLAICKAVDIALGYCKKLACLFCEKVAREVSKAIVAPLLAPIGEFLEVGGIVLAYSLAVGALLVFANAIPRRS